MLHAARFFPDQSGAASMTVSRVLRARFLLARFLVAAVAMSGVLMAVFRATQPRVKPLVAPPEALLAVARGDTMARLIQLYTGLRLEPGNDVQLLLNGEGTYPRLWRDLANARRSITVQSYYNSAGATADTLSRILRLKARQGVRVLVLLDAFGSTGVRVPDRWLADLRRAGIRAERLRPLRWQTVHGAADRSHVRAIVIDGQVGYTGGFGFADYWQGSGARENEWRETNVRFTGPAAQQLQAAFGAAWLEATGELLVAPRFFPAEPRTGRAPAVTAGVMYTTGSIGSTPAERFLTLTVLGSAKRLYITNSYFVPNADLRRLLRGAVARGVDVRVLTAGPGTDVAATRHAGRRHYEELLRAGVRIWEYDAAMMHAKTITVDGAWAAVGSMNFDNRSASFNDEAMLVVSDARVAQALEEVFVRDLDRASEILLPRFLGRSRWERFLEVSADMLAALL
jgi:cardiolipin synthase